MAINLSQPNLLHGGRSTGYTLDSLPAFVSRGRRASFEMLVPLSPLPSPLSSLLSPIPHLPSPISHLPLPPAFSPTSAEIALDSWSFARLHTDGLGTGIVGLGQSEVSGQTCSWFVLPIGRVLQQLWLAAPISLAYP